MSKLAKALMMGAAGAAGEKVYVEDVFSTWLYTGNSSTQTITNGIDLDGEGGAVWIKKRDLPQVAHFLYDTNRGATKYLFVNATNAESTNVNDLTAFNSDGFSLGAGSNVNYTGWTYASWTFRKAEKFFDVVTYTGNGTAGRTVAHNLGSVPGCIIVKRTNSTSDWTVYHRTLSNTQYLKLNLTVGTQTSANIWNSTTPTDTEFTLGSDADVNNASGTYVAYLFAHDAGGFGDDGTESVIKCGSYTGNGSTSGPTIDLGWEPQWVLIKNTNSSSFNWELVDVMRGMTHTGHSRLSPNTSNAEVTDTTAIAPLATGFQIRDSGGNFNQSGSTFIYIAIRRGPMKTPTDATTVFNATSYTGDGSTPRSFTTGVTADAIFHTNPPSNWISGGILQSRLTNTRLTTQFTNDENSSVYFSLNDSSANTGATVTSANYNNSGTSYLLYSFRRAPGFFDVVAYTGTGSATTVSHNLGVAPELMIVKRRDLTESWAVYSGSLPASDRLRLNWDGGAATISAYWNSTAPTSSVFTVGTDNATNASGSTYIAYLFATCPGVSKVGNYTGTGATLDVDCGFSAGARFVLIKRTDSTGDWYVWDTARGIISGDDPYLLLNSTDAEVTNTDYIDPLSSGFQISSTAPDAINADGGSFIFLAIA